MPIRLAPQHVFGIGYWEFGIQFAVWSPVISPHAIIFDLDGTLADTIDGIVQCMNDLLLRHGLPTHTPDAYRRMIGDGITKLVERALPADRQHMIDEFTAEYLPHLEAKGKALARLYDGIEPMLDDLTAREIPLAILSNKPHEATVGVVEHLLGRWPWQMVRGHVAGTPVKPDPTTAHAMCKTMQIEPVHAFYVGDSNVDMDLAANASFIGVGAAWGLRGRAELEAHGAKHVLESPGELIDLLSK